MQARRGLGGVLGGLLRGSTGWTRRLLCIGLVSLGLGAAAHAASASAAANWVEGSNYFLLQPPQATAVAAGKVEVTEVFSFACPACNSFYPIVDQLKAALPPNAELDFVPASFRPDEDWPVFQRAFYAAQVLGIEQRTHDALFDAIWKTGELAVIDPRTQRLRVPVPNIQDIAGFYARTAGVKPETFVSTANSFGVDTRMRQADQLVKDYRVEGTPTIIVNGKYRLDVQSAGSPGRVIELVKFLVAKEAPATKAAAH